MHVHKKSSPLAVVRQMQSRLSHATVTTWDFRSRGLHCQCSTNNMVGPELQCSGSALQPHAFQTSEAPPSIHTMPILPGGKLRLSPTGSASASTTRDLNWCLNMWFHAALHPCHIDIRHIQPAAAAPVPSFSQTPETQSQPEY